MKINKKLQKELLEMFNKDQKAIEEKDSNFYQITVNNKKRLNSIIKKCGWPSDKLVGEKGEMAAWLIAQHADFDVKFQEKCLKLLKKLPLTKKRKKHIVYLIDRTLVNRKRKQVFGTQFYKGKDGKVKPRPIRNIKNLDKTRKEFGLEPFNKYKKHMIKVNS
ncbi:MAG: hypothetical protein KKG75_01680 [Nanoarchaeota archaeon]|nr:hypothetical protein [Nanoarchaeota archaeon]